MSEEKLRNIRAMLKDEASYPFVTDVIKVSKVGRTTFYRHFPPEEIQKLRLLTK
ncbi:hypothetical protein FACS1894122_13400 [Alphaproteobacteria bacterium]|nr:hypothetical protein FACS1894122_13400 [Alphaproteobacteria bacterium]